MPPHSDHPPSKLKKVARLYSNTPGTDGKMGRQYNVDYPDDLAEIRDKGQGQLVCSYPNCPASFQKPRQSRNSTWYLANMPGSTGCGHALIRDPEAATGGGPMTPEHKWLQSRIWRICVKIGYDAYPEDYATNADVYVPNSGPDTATATATGGGYAIEVQRVSTNVPHRTEARRAQGARTLWLLTDSIQGKEADRLLFQNPAIRIRVVDKEDKKTVLAPWDDPKLNPRAYLQVSATLAEYKDEQRSLDKSKGRRSGYTFLVQVLNGERTWHSASELRPLGLTYGAWVLKADIEKARAAVKEDQQREAQERKAELERAAEEAEIARNQPEAEPAPQEKPGPPRAAVVEPQPLPSPTPPRLVPQAPAPKPIAKPAPARPSPVTAQQPKQQAPSLLRSIRKLFGLD